MTTHQPSTTAHQPPPGYKQTDVGVIPEEWNAAHLAAVCAMKSGAGITSANIDTFSQYPCYGGNGLRGYTSRFTHAGSYALIGRQGALCGNVLGVEGTFFASEHAIVVTAFPQTDIRWLTYMLGEMRLNQYSESSAQPGLSVAKLLNLDLAVPSTKAEQRAIAEALSDVDALLGALDRLIAKKRDIKRATMQQLLTGQTRLPGFQGEWGVKRLGDVADVKTGPFGSTLHESDYVRDGTPIITVEHLGDFGVEHFNLPLISDFDRQRLRAYALEIGDIVFSRVGSVDRNALIRPAEAGWLFSGRLLRVRPDKPKAFAPFLSYQFHGEAFITEVRNVAVGQTMACLNTQILKGIPVKLPTVHEQTAIAGVLGEMDAELVALEQRREKTRALKKAMMQELLTGRTRLV